MSRQGVSQLAEERRYKIITALIAQKKVINRPRGTTLDDLIDEYEKSHPITQCSVGVWHAVFVKSDGEVWVCGRNFNGELGVIDREKHATEPEPASFHIPSGVKQVIAGNGFSLFVSNDGEVYVCGYGAHLLLGDIVGDMSKGLVKVPIPFDAPIDAVATGDEHISLLTKDGRVFGYGLNQYGELGLGGVKLGETFHELDVAEGQSVKAIATGCEHSVFLTTEGDVYTCGNRHFGALGVGYESVALKFDSAKSQRVRLKPWEKCKAIAAGARQTQLVTTEGKIYSFGTLYNQPHLPVNEPAVVTGVHQAYSGGVFAVRDAGFKELPRIACATATDDHALLQADDGRVFITGHRGRGEKLKLSFENAAEIKLLNGIKAVDIDIKPGRRLAIVADDGSVCLSPDACHWLGLEVDAFKSYGFSAMYMMGREAFEVKPQMITCPRVCLL
ncbi:MAG: hypothetical protein P1U63_10515 [Coxiellaceae bacterium]|nr:hypothetical protein [Coxiellaceae bacterium]